MSSATVLKTFPSGFYQKCSCTFMTFYQNQAESKISRIVAKNSTVLTFSHLSIGHNRAIIRCKLRANFSLPIDSRWQKDTSPFSLLSNENSSRWLKSEYRAPAPAALSWVTIIVSLKSSRGQLYCDWRTWQPYKLSVLHAPGVQTAYKYVYLPEMQISLTTNL